MYNFPAETVIFVRLFYEKGTLHTASACRDGL